MALMFYEENIMTTTVLLNGQIVTGDGKTFIETGTVIITDGNIKEVISGYQEKKMFSETEYIIDASDLLMMPGVINHHTHGIVQGPLYPSGAKKIGWDHIKYNLDKHLMEGTTTLMSVCGFSSMDEVDEVNKKHPINIKTATCHTPINFKAAKLADGTGLEDKHLTLTVEKMLEHGAAAIGEIGAGHTLGGGGQDYLYIPKAIEKETGKLLTTPEARALKYSILGRKIDKNAFNPDRVKGVLEELGLSQQISVQRAKEIVENCVLPSYEVALEGMFEAAELGKVLKVPVIVHNAASSMDTVEKVCQSESNIIAGHSNHPSFEVEECVKHAKKIKSLGKTIDVSSLDMFDARQLCESTDIVLALMREGVVDTISTDYAGGYWDSILRITEKAVEEDILDLPTAVAMTSSNVCKAIPLLAPERGLIEKGKIADILLVKKEKISDVERVFINGKEVVRGGKIVYQV